MVKIISDSTCDLSPELVAKYDITLIPLTVRLGDSTYLDGVDITPDEIYAWSNETKKSPATACANTWQIREIFEKLREDGSDLVAFTISASMSATCTNMHQAVKDLNAEGHIAVIDSQNLSTGIGLLVLEAAEMAHKGAGLAEIKAHVEALRPRVRASFVVDTLTFLYRGGRCSGLAALAGSVMKLHPSILVQSGAMVVGKKYRGNLERATTAYVTDLEEELRKADPKHVFITHSGTDEAIIEQVKAQLIALNRFEEILVTRAGGVVSCHCGPGTLGVLFIAG